jgi:hypothetical protein
MATTLADKTYTRPMSVVDTTISALEEERLLEGAMHCWEKHGKALVAEMQWWLDLPGPPLPDDDWSDALPAND